MKLHLCLSLLTLTEYASAFSPIAKVTRKPSSLPATETVVQDFRATTTIPETQAAAAHTFAAKVENAIIEKHGEAESKRVIDSWRLLDQDYEHREYFGKDQDDDDQAATDPATSNCFQYAHSYVPGLSCKPFWDVDEFAWSEKLAKSYKQIRKEFLDVTKDMAKLSQEGNNIWAGALTAEAGGYGEGWSTLVLKDRGIWDEVNCNLFPKTAKAVHASGIPATEVFFASMKPRTDIKLHSDFTNFVLTSHLAIDIPENGNNKCRLSIGDETRQWINGEVMVFDTSIMHDAINESDDTRYILMFRLWHPDLSEVERNALQTVYDCLSFPELIDENDAVRVAAEEEIEVMRNFPKLKSSSAGFGGGSTASAKQKKNGKR